MTAAPSQLLTVTTDICGFALVAYLAYESAVSLRKYRRTKEAIAGGDPAARSHLYYEILRFELISAVLAIVALQFDPTRLTPSGLQIATTAFGQWWISAWHRLDSAFLVGLSAGAVISLVAITVRLRRARSQITPPTPTPSRWRRVIPDFSALIPTTPRERALFVLVALSAGICEEIVYRAWLLDVLHGVGGLTGGTLVVVAALLFGLGHYYQGMAGILVTAAIGLILCGVYIATGSLVIPIVIHTLIDLRVAILPSPATAK